jgi:hypothetical protein
MNDHIGDKVGYVALRQDRWGGWDETNSTQMDTIGQAVGLIRRYQEEDPKATYAVGRIELVMISRPDEGDNQ